MKAVVLGAGMMGSVIAVELAESPEISSVLVCDIDESKLEQCAGQAPGDKLEVQRLNVENRQQLLGVLRKADVAASALAHRFSIPVLRAAIEAGTHMVDLVGSEPGQKLAMDEEAREAGVAIIPGFGLAPGLTNVLVGVGFERLDSVLTAVARVGGLPLNPQPPLDYQIVYCMESTFNQYVRDATVIKDSKITTVPAMSDRETLRLPEPIGECECFVTDGLGTLPLTLGDPHLEYMAEKTIRYPGHADRIQTLIDCGLFDREPVTVGGTEVIPRRLLDELLRGRLQPDDPRDISVLQVEVTGNSGRRTLTHTFEMIDVYDEENDVTSMARTTAFPASIAVRMLLRGDITRRGVLPAETTFMGENYDILLEELSQKNITIEDRTSVR